VALYDIWSERWEGGAIFGFLKRLGNVRCFSASKCLKNSGKRNGYPAATGAKLGPLFILSKSSCRFSGGNGSLLEDNPLSFSVGSFSSDSSLGFQGVDDEFGSIRSDSQTFRDFGPRHRRVLFKERSRLNFYL
jgi:hypothetical protein